MLDGEYHVASFVVSTRPENSIELARHINTVAGLEVHAEQRGKLIVTAEARNVRDLAKLAARLEAMEYVLAVAPVYHEFDGAKKSATPMASAEN